MKEFLSCRWVIILSPIVAGLLLSPIGVVSGNADIGTGVGTDTGMPPITGRETTGSPGTLIGTGTDNNPDTTPLDHYLRYIGASLVEKNPELKSASDVEKARAGFKEYLKLLSRQDAGVSNDLWGRINDLFHDERTTFTCSAHTQNLRDLFEAMGIDPASLGQISGEMETINPFNVNSDHGALVLIGSDGEKYVFDAWAHATDRDSWSPFDDLYSEADTSAFNGMGLTDWDKMMRNGGYTSFIYQNNDGAEGKSDTAFGAFDSAFSPGQMADVVRKNIAKNPINKTDDGKLNCDGAPAVNGVGCWRVYDNGTLLQTGHWIYYYDSGLKMKSSEGDYENGLKVGRWISYYSDGSKFSETNFVAGIPYP